MQTGQAKFRSPLSGSRLHDLRFRALLPAADWDRPPEAVRRRSRRLADGETATYVGEIVEATFSRIGFWLAQLARLVSAPLPLCADIHVPGIVTVAEDMTSGGQVWTRIYARRKAFPQVIHYAKRFGGPTRPGGLTVTHRDLDDGEFVFGFALTIRASAC
jgi:hypothetical protein